MDYGHKRTDKLLSDLEQDIRDIYNEANESAKKKADTYFETFKEQDAKMAEKLKNKQITEKEYKEWRIKQMSQGARYKAMSNSLAKDLTNADKLAASAINGHLPDVYATNYNWGTYEIEKDAHIDTNFIIYDRQTVERLIRDKPDLLPMQASIDIPEDLRWNKKLINNAVTQGILLGESIPDIASRLASVTDMNQTAAVRNARTMTTSAENGGRTDSYKRAEDMGIKLTQQWVATMDGRTRHQHRELNGQEVKVGGKFKIDGYDLKFPGDPSAPPYLIYNCRCCLVSNFKGFDYKKMDKYIEEKPMSYKEWEKEHKKETEPEVKPISTYKYLFPKYTELSETVEDYYDEVYEPEFLKMNERMSATDKERELIAYNYTQSASSFNINKALRENSTQTLTKDEKDTIKALHSVIQKNTLEQDVVLTRQVSASATTNILGFHMDTDEVEELISMVLDGSVVEPFESLYGTIVTEKGFVSTSIVPETNVFTGKYQLKMLADKGTHIYITDNADESEAILDYGTKYKIIGSEPYNMYSNMSLAEYLEDNDIDDIDIANWGIRLIVKVIK